MTTGGPAGLVLAVLSEAKVRYGDPRAWNRPIVIDWVRRRCRALMDGTPERATPTEAEREPGEEG